MIREWWYKISKWPSVSKHDNSVCFIRSFFSFSLTSPSESFIASPHSLVEWMCGGIHSLHRRKREWNICFKIELLIHDICSSFTRGLGGEQVRFCSAGFLSSALAWERCQDLQSEIVPPPAPRPQQRKLKSAFSVHNLANHQTPTPRPGHLESKSHSSCNSQEMEW